MPLGTPAFRRLTAAEKLANAQRAERAEGIIADYKIAANDPDESTEVAIVDLLADLQHLTRVIADRQDPNGFLLWERLLSGARTHFMCEVYGE